MIETEKKIQILLEEQEYWFEKLMQRIEDLFDMAEEEGFVFSWAFDPKSVRRWEND